MTLNPITYTLYPASVVQELASTFGALAAARRALEERDFLIAAHGRSEAALAEHADALAAGLAALTADTQLLFERCAPSAQGAAPDVMYHNSPLPLTLAQAGRGGCAGGRQRGRRGGAARCGRAAPGRAGGRRGRGRGRRGEPLRGRAVGPRHARRPR